MYDRNERPDLKAIQRDIVERNAEGGPSLRRSLLSDVTSAALKHAEAIGADADQFYRLADEGVAVVNSLQFSLTEDYRTRNANFWRHDDRAFEAIRDCKTPYMARQDIENTASDYLALPYRAPFLERTLLDVVVAVTVALGGAFMLAASGYTTASNFVLGFFLVGAVGSWYSRFKMRGTVSKLLKRMLATYAELAGEGPISARRVREVAEKAANSGVVWPGAVFALLYDSITRIGRTT